MMEEGRIWMVDLRFSSLVRSGDGVWLSCYEPSDKIEILDSIVSWCITSFVGWGGVIFVVFCRSMPDATCTLSVAECSHMFGFQTSISFLSLSLPLHTKRKQSVKANDPLLHFQYQSLPSRFASRRRCCP